MRIGTEGLRPSAFPGFGQSSYLDFREDIMPVDVLGPRALDDTMAHLASSRSFDIRVETSPSETAPQEHRQPIKEYGERWDWNGDVHDYVRYTEDGTMLLYSNYQLDGSPPSSSARPDEDHHSSNSENKGESQVIPKSPKPGHDIPKAVKTRAPETPSYDEPLGDDFQVVAKPKRFFTVGRIFKAVWFEPGAAPVKPTTSGPEPWVTKCPGFHGEKPIARFRWFIVVRRRLHHSLCFSITTYSGGKGGGGAGRGRPADYVVLYRSNIEPPQPHDDEEITRDPIAVIIEDGEQYISPFARLDCGRIYTVEDNLKVSKVGRVHPGSLATLEECYEECMA